MSRVTGRIRKMVNALSTPVTYHLPIGDTQLHLNPLVGQEIRLEFHGIISCIYCDRKIKKTYNQGYCFPCFRRLARCDRCIVSPELCHYHRGTCREPAWGREHCLQPHIVYLASASGIKVGITREVNIPNRWIDQGAHQAIPIFRVPDRRVSGLLEVIFKSQVSDRTNWRAMLRGDPEPLDLVAERDRLLDRLADQLDQLQQQQQIELEPLHHAQPVELQYPSIGPPQRISSVDLIKQSRVGGKLLAIKGQYLVFEDQAINLRKHAGFHLELFA